MRASFAVAILLVPVLVLGGGVSALAAAPGEYEERRLAVEGYDEALVAAAEARESAQLSLDRYLSLAADARSALAVVASLRAADSALLDATTTAALTPLGEALTDALPDPGPTLEARPPLVHDTDPEALAAATDDVIGWADRLRELWVAHDTEFATIGAALHRVRVGIMAVAGSVAATGRSILGDSGSASAQSRAALSDALAHIAAHIEDGTDPTADIAAYLTAARAVQDSHAEAAAAEQAAAARTSNPPPTGIRSREDILYDFAYRLCHPEGIAVSYPCVVDLGDGTILTFYS